MTTVLVKEEEMKKGIIVLFISMMLLSTASIQAESKQVKLYGGLGLGLNKFTGLTMNLGGEMDLTDKIVLGAAFDYYFSPGNDVEGIDTSLFSLGAYGKYKFELSEKIGAFAKAGFVYARAKASADFMGADISATSSDVGLVTGAGIEIPMGEKLSIQTGIDLFIAGGTWTKVYGNICYRIK